MKPSYQSYSRDYSTSSYSMPAAHEEMSYGCEMAMPEKLDSLDCALDYISKDLGCEMKMSQDECNSELKLDRCVKENAKKAPSRGFFSLFGGKSKKSKTDAAPKMMNKKKMTAPEMAAPMVSLREDMAMSRGSMKMMSAAPENFEME